MEPTRLRQLLARPALHVILALLFFGAFAWPLFAVDRRGGASRSLLAASCEPEPRDPALPGAG